MFWRKKKQAKVIPLNSSNNANNQTNKTTEKGESQSKMESINTYFNDKYGAAFTPDNNQSKNKAEPLRGDFCFNKL